MQHLTLLENMTIIFLFCMLLLCGQEISFEECCSHSDVEEVWHLSQMPFSLVVTNEGTKQNRQKWADSGRKNRKMNLYPEGF